MSRACTVPVGSRFWHLSTHAHGRAVRTNVLDGLEVLFESLDWAHPGARIWPTPPFHTFASTKLTYGCTYDNPTTLTIRNGESEQSEEECIAVGYFFPSTRPEVCYNGFALP